MAVGLVHIGIPLAMKVDIKYNSVSKGAGDLLRLRVEDLAPS